MSIVKIQGNASGTGILTIAAPNTNSDRTLTLPDQTGTVLTNAGPFTANASASAGAVTIDASNNVGIGNTSPEVISNFVSLDVGSSSTKQGYIQANDGTTKTVIWSTGGLGKVGTRTVHPLSFQINSSEAAQIDTSSNFKFNSGYGSVATAYGCRAWVNFNGTGTVAIRASGNVTSITDNGVGLYTVNFTNAMPDANYATTIGVGERTNDQRVACPMNETTTSVQIGTRYQLNLGSRDDSSDVSVSIFR